MFFPFKYLVHAICKWSWLVLYFAAVWVLTYFPMGLLVAYFCKPMTNKFGESEAIHSDKYIAAGSSGKWIFEDCLIPIITLWANPEDGQRGEPSGKWSSACKGKEATFWNKYAWARRNPYNRGKRESDVFACFVNDCKVEWWGDKGVSDKNLNGDGRYFIRAQHKETGRVYYGYRRVIHWDNLGWYRMLVGLVFKVSPAFAGWLSHRVYNAVLGFKIKPEHAEEVQDADDLDKAFTFRIQFFSKVN